MKFARRVFLLAALEGFIVVPPMYFVERRYGLDNPPPVTHPEFYYGFVGVTLAWQVAFLIMSFDPIRYRPLMLAAIVEKVTFVIAVWVLVESGRAPGSIVPFALIDLVFGVLFLVSWWRTRRDAVAELL
jgi:hypothetical protein